MHLPSQIDDYRYRGEALEGSSFLEFFVDTYEERLRVCGSEDNGEPSATRLGRRKNTRVPYQIQHPRANTVHRVFCTAGHRNLPDIVGPWFERSDDPATYPLHCASVLACLKLWRTFEDLKSGCTSWSEALESYMASANDKHQSICANMQYYYQCRESADTEINAPAPANPEGDVVTPLDLSELVNGVPIGKVMISPLKQKELDHAEDAASIGQRIRIFGNPGEGDGGSGSSEVATADEALYNNIKLWTTKLKEATMDLRLTKQDAPAIGVGNAENIGGVGHIGESSGHAPPAAIVYQGDTDLTQVDEVDVSM